MSPRRVAALFLIITLLTMTGCIQLPQRVNRTTDPRPSLSTAAATALVKRFRRIDAAAWKRLDPSHLREVITGPELEFETQAIMTEEEIGGKNRSSDLPKDSHYTVSSTPGGQYPALAVISGTRKGQKSADSHYLAERASAGDPWLISYAAGTHLNTFLPGLSNRHDRTFEPVAPTTKVNGISADKMSDLLTDALLQPKSKAAGHFVANDSFNDAKSVPLDKKQGAHLQKQYEYVSAPWKQAYLTAKGDLIIFGAFTQTTRYDSAANYYRYFKSGYAKKLLPGKYSSLTYTHFWQYAVRVPKKGKFAVQDVSWTLENLTGEDYVPS